MSEYVMDGLSKDDLERLRDCVLVARRHVTVSTLDYRRSTELVQRIESALAAAPTPPAGDAVAYVDVDGGGARLRMVHAPWPSGTHALYSAPQPVAAAPLEPAPAVDAELLRIGARLANAAYNLAQSDRLNEYQRKALDNDRKAWDAAIQNRADETGGNGNG